MSTGWDDIKVTYTNGHTEQTEHFLSPSHAVDIVRRMLLASNMVWDNSRPIQVGHFIRQYSHYGLVALIF